VINIATPSRRSELLLAERRQRSCENLCCIHRGDRSPRFGVEATLMSTPPAPKVSACYVHWWYCGIMCNRLFMHQFWGLYYQTTDSQVLIILGHSGSDPPHLEMDRLYWSKICDCGSAQIVVVRHGGGAVSAISLSQCVYVCWCVAMSL